MPHQIYKNKDGKRLVGVTTVCGVLNKPALLQWANKIGLQGIEMTSYVDNLAGIGTLAHGMCTSFLGVAPDFDYNDYTENQITLATQAFNSFKAWYELNKVELISAEQALISEDYQYGGCYDIYAYLNGLKTLIDLKSGSAIYPEHILQVAGGYGLLMKENDLEVEQVLILNIPRTDNENFGTLLVNTKQRELAERMFLLCREMYELQRELKNETQIIYPKKHIKGKYEVKE